MGLNDSAEEKNQSVVNGNSNTLIIKNSKGIVVAKISIKNAVLDGHCEWRNGEGELVAYGTFKKGMPYAGTFLNWSTFFSELKDNPYGLPLYAKDWITVFEESFLSESPTYYKLLEFYYKGEKISRI